MMTAVEFRRLAPADLDSIEAIERRAYPTPWSRSMFAGELAKPGGFCVGAFQGSEMLGYVIVAKYVDAWHVMNIAVDEPHRGRGIARALLGRSRKGVLLLRTTYTSGGQTTTKLRQIKLKR